MPIFQKYADRFGVMMDVLFTDFLPHIRYFLRLHMT